VNSCSFLVYWGILVCLQKYDSFKDSLPDMSWMKDYLPDKEYIDKMSQHLQQFRSRISWQDIPDFKVCYFVYKVI